MLFQNAYQLIIKVSLISASGFFAQVHPLAEIGIEKGFDQAFSIGIMFLFILYMIFENRAKDKQKDKVLADNLLVHQETLKAINNFSESNKDVAKSVERSTAIQAELVKNVQALSVKTQN